MSNASGSETAGGCEADVALVTAANDNGLDDAVDGWVGRVEGEAHGPP